MPSHKYSATLNEVLFIYQDQRRFYKYMYKMYEDEKQDELPALPLNDALEAIGVVNNSLLTEGMSHYIVTVLRVLGNHFCFSFFCIDNGTGYLLPLIRGNLIRVNFICRGFFQQDDGY